MQDKTQSKTHTAILLVLRPLARVLLKGGVGFREFSELAKRAFVDVATQDYGLRGRPTNISRVAVMTGLTRKEVRRIRQLIEDGSDDLGNKDTPMSQILHRWHTDTDYLTEHGEPRELAYDGEDCSFASLVKKYGGDVPPGAMRTELERIEAIEQSPGQKLKPTTRIVYKVELHDRIIGGLTNILYPAALNLAHNVRRTDSRGHWANLVTHSNYIRPSDSGRYLRISNDRITEFAKSIDDLQAGFEAMYDVDQDGVPSDGRTFGVGVFYFEEDKKDSNFFD